MQSRKSKRVAVVSELVISVAEVVTFLTGSPYDLLVAVLPIVSHLSVATSRPPSVSMDWHTSSPRIHTTQPVLTPLPGN
ncbi:hypothetical protein E2C01_035683 [Portunus trituberculatus]|uniref:Uncharacterized protein n=1 Tax=Portunus trituberculatus TaxID=210409 RepID=A0A5B7F3T3_PORTR|nr:hypothetical protein [Portunus trituberculatus]